MQHSGTSLTDNLQQRYQVKPVHTLDEMLLLASRFPEQIKLYTASVEGEVLGGTVVYETPHVIHTQYISASAEGKRRHALDMLFDKLIHHIYADRDFFDFGKSTEEHGTVLNESLIFQKEGFGGRGVCYDTYEWEV